MTPLTPESIRASKANLPPIGSVITKLRRQEAGRRLHNPGPAAGGRSPKADRIFQLIDVLQARLDHRCKGQVIGPVLEAPRGAVAVLLLLDVRVLAAQFCDHRADRR